MDLSFGPLRKDLAITTPRVCSKAVNVLPKAGVNGIDYGPFKGLSIFNSAQALPAAPRGGAATVTSAGSYRAFVGTATHIYQMNADYSWTERGSGYGLPAGKNWSMQQFGHYLIASNSDDGMLAIDVDGAPSFAAIANAPKAETIFEAFGCLFATNCDGDNMLMRNSDIDNHTNWKTGLAQYQPFSEGEALVGGVELSDGLALVFQKNAVRRMDRRNSSSLYTLDKVADERGAVSPDAITSFNGIAYFVDNDGIYASDGGRPVPIGSNKVTQTFLDGVYPGTLRNVQVVADPKRELILFRYRKASVASDSIFEDMLAFDPKLNEFVDIEVKTSFIISLPLPAMTLEDLSSISDLDSLPFSLDSPVWAGGESRLGGLDENFKFGVFDGENLAATLDTNVLDFSGSAKVRSARPNTDAKNATLSLGVRSRLQSETVWKDAVAIQPSGRVPLRGRGNAAQLRLNIPAGEDWTSASGINNVEMLLDGAR